MNNQCQNSNYTARKRWFSFRPSTARSRNAGTSFTASFSKIAGSAGPSPSPEERRGPSARRWRSIKMIEFVYISALLLSREAGCEDFPSTVLPYDARRRLQPLRALSVLSAKAGQRRHGLQRQRLERDSQPRQIPSRSIDQAQEQVQLALSQGSSRQHPREE